MDQVAIGEKMGSPEHLVFQDMWETNSTDDLTGKSLVPELVSGAKREEITEIYRRGVWLEQPVEDCFREAGKPPVLFVRC